MDLLRKFKDKHGESIKAESARSLINAEKRLTFGFNKCII